MSFFDCTTELVTVGLGRCVDFREIDQLMAGANGIQATQSHQGADGRLAFTEGKQLSAEISKSTLRLPHVSRGLVILADLPGTDRQLSRPRQLHVSEGKHPFERLVSKAKSRLYRSADQFERHLAQKEEGRNRHQVDTPLHVAPQSDRRFNSGFALTAASAARASRNEGRAFAGSRLRIRPGSFQAPLPTRGLPDQSTLMHRYSQG